jgi:hypothetical protein
LAACHQRIRDLSHQQLATPAISFVALQEPVQVSRSIFFVTSGARSFFLSDIFEILLKLSKNNLLRA